MSSAWLRAGDWVEVRSKAQILGSAAHVEDVCCNGGAHGGRQAGCLTFSTEVWLNPVADVDAEDSRAAAQRIGFARNRLGILGNLVK